MTNVFLSKSFVDLRLFYNVVKDLCNAAYMLELSENQWLFEWNPA
jgi:hypothetical protein